MWTTIAAIVQLLLTVVTLLIRKGNEAQLKELGANEVVQKQLTELATSTGIAKQLSEKWKSASDSDVDDFLRDKFRD